MEIPEDIQGIINRIYECEDEWIALYMGAWGCATFYLKPTYENTDAWEKKLEFGLPAFPKGFHKYTPKQLYSILTSKDIEFTLSHLQTLFSLLEELIRELCPIVCDGKKIDSTYFKTMNEFLLGKGKYSNFKLGIPEEVLSELKLAKRTRDCFIHHGGRVDSNKNGFLLAYGEARRERAPVSPGDDVYTAFSNIYHQVFSWHNLIISIVKKIERYIEENDF